MNEDYYIEFKICNFFHIYNFSLEINITKYEQNALQFRYLGILLLFAKC